MAKSKKEPEINIEPTGQLFVEPLEKVLHISMLPYAEFVILDRALPRVEDGLKPVQRRILYTMHEMGLTPDKPHKKSARIVGECMGKFHPHGDSSVYDAMVRMAQDFNMGKTLVNGHGNFGSVDGDPAAAMRYTEARLEPLALEMLRDIDKETVSFSLNFDDTLKEPDVLPGRFPNLLVNGASGIAVGLATNIPTHNLGEVINGVSAYIDDPAISLDEMMKYIPCPDFPTGGTIIANELIQAYKTGRGKITIRAKLHLEEEGNKTNIVITELPYQVNKAQLMRKIAEMQAEKKEQLAGIDYVADESDRNGMRALIRVKKDTDIDALLAYLFKYTDLEVTFGINMVVIADGKPQQLGLMEIIRHYVEYQRQVVLKRTVFDLNQAEQRCHVLEGLIIAVRNIDEVIAIIKKADGPSDARSKLMERFSITEIQAQAILDLRLARLTKLEVYKLEQELEELKKLIKKLTAISKSKEKQLQVVKEEINEIREKYASPRRSKLVFSSEEANEMISAKAERAPGEKCTFVCTWDDKCKVLIGKQAEAMKKPVEGKFKAGNIVKIFLETDTDKRVFAFTNFGNCHKLDIYDPALSCKLTESGRQFSEIAKGALDGERPVAFFEIGDKFPMGNLLFFTKNGMIKKTDWSEYDNQKKDCFQALKLAEDDELLCVQEDGDQDETILFVTEGGYCLNAKKDDIPTQGRVAGGVRGIMLREGDFVKFVSQTDGEGEIVIATSEGRFKKVITSLIDPMGRYKKGSMIVSMPDGEKVICAYPVTVPYAMAVVEKGGSVSELSTEEIPIAVQSAKARKVRYDESLVINVIPLYYKLED